MKKILGLDLGTTSIGWALVEEDQSKEERKSKIVKLGVRIIQYDTFNKVDKKSRKITPSKNPIDDFASGKGLSPNAERTQQRGARRNLQHYKQRRKNLIEILIKNSLITKETPLTETGKNTTYQTLFLRAKAAKKQIKLEEFARVLLAINKKRGYKSNRKAKGQDEGQAIDGMSVAKELYENNLTIGQYVYQLLQKGKKYIPDFYRSDLQGEFDKVWNFQKQFYAEILTDELKEKLKDKNKGQTWKICEKPFDIVGISQKGKPNEKRLECYKWRVEGLSKKLELEYLAIVLQEINNNLNSSSGYLGDISDRSKELYFKKETVGENLYKQIQNNPHTRLKGQIFYRQDYLDEFEKIWGTQAKYYSELTTKLKEEIRDVIIFYQRKLKSQKGLLSFCEFESWQEKYTDKATGKEKKRQVGYRVIPKSSPLFQEFKIWQNLNNLELENIETQEKIIFRDLDEDIRQIIFNELNLRGNLKINKVIKLLSNHLELGTLSKWESNFKEIEGNWTNKTLYGVYEKIAEYEGYGFDWAKKQASEIKEELKIIFSEIGINSEILEFDAELEKEDFDKQKSHQLWHLLYSVEEDDALKNKLHSKYDFKPEYASMLANVTLQKDHGNLSTKAIKKIIPFLKAGHKYSDACKFAKYNHSHSLTAEERADRILQDKLEPLRKNSLRNPVVEKILNQMINVVNQVTDTYGKPDEIRIELARDLKKSAKERADMTKGINSAKTRHTEIRKLLQESPFHIPNPTRNDIIRYKLYQELKGNGYHSLYTNKYIPKEKLFSKEIQIEHIIPKAKLFDDSFSNKTLAYDKPNRDKGDRTAIDFISDDFLDDLDNYKARVKNLYDKGKGDISRGKLNKLLMEGKDIPDDFIQRDLRDSQYIAKKAKQLLEEVVRTVNTTTGSITSKLREDWDLINVMQELNIPKFKAIDENLIEQVEKKDGSFKTRIKDWSKRNDHRHHAMDALTVAFTTYDHVQYLNNLNTISNLKEEGVNHEKSDLDGIKEKVTKYYPSKNGKKRLKFIPPMPNFRKEAEKHIKSILISFKAKNKVITKNINKTKVKDGYTKKVQLTPRGRLHKDTIYGKSKQALSKPTKISKKFDIKNVNLIINKDKKAVLKNHLAQFQNNPKIAFDTKTLKKHPLIYKDKPLKEVLCFQEVYTIRKEISPDLRIDKVIDKGIQKILYDRLEEFEGKPKEAFSNLDKNPIWLNKEKGISIKRVSISGVKNVEVLHHKKNHLGNVILDEEGKPIPTDYVSTGNNHHVAIYKDENGKLQEKVVSFYEAVANVNTGLPIIDKQYKGWQFLFTMKQNEMFVFPSEGFNPSEVDLEDEKNASLISKHLFRVQKIATKDYMFTHHLETKGTTGDDLKNIKQLSSHKYNYIQSTEHLRNIIKVRINHLGRIVKVGEY